MNKNMGEKNKIKCACTRIEVWLPICTYSESRGPSDRYLQNIDVYQAIYSSDAIS